MNGGPSVFNRVSSESTGHGTPKIGNFQKNLRISANIARTENPMVFFLEERI